MKDIQEKHYTNRFFYGHTMTKKGKGKFTPTKEYACARNMLIKYNFLFTLKNSLKRKVFVAAPFSHKVNL